MSKESDNRPEETLRSSEQELRLLVEAIPTLVWRAGQDGNIEYVNQRVLDYFGAPLSEVTGWGWMDKVHPDDVAFKVRTWLQNLESESLTMSYADFAERTADIGGSRSAENHCEPTMAR
jgi:PAS domain S-box-containing protein